MWRLKQFDGSGEDGIYKEFVHVLNMMRCLQCLALLVLARSNRHSDIRLRAREVGESKSYWVVWFVD